jgi:hypothetical protein
MSLIGQGVPQRTDSETGHLKGAVFVVFEGEADYIKRCFEESG